MKNYFLLPLLFLSQLLSSQDLLLFEDSRSETLVYRYHNLNGSSASTLRQIFQLLNVPHHSSASIDLSYQYQMRILEEQDQLKVCVNWLKLAIDNAPQPSGFYFGDLLLPASVNYQLQLLADGEVIKTEDICQNLTGNQLSYISGYGAVTGGVYYTLQVSNIYFNYGSRELQLVQNRSKAIEQYLSAKADLTVIKNRVAQLTDITPLPAELPALQQEMKQIRLTFNNIGKASFWQILNLRTADAYDPEDLLAMYTACDVEIASRQNWLNEQQANIHILYYDQGVSLYEQGHERAAYDAFCASLRANDCFAPSHYFVAYFDFAAGRVADAALRLQKVINQYDPDPATRQNAYQLARGIVRFHLDAGQEAVARKDYPAAVSCYENALGFSQNLHGFQYGQVEAASRIQEAYTYDYQDRLNYTISLHRNGQNHEALASLDEATAFRQEFGVSSNYDTRGLAGDIVNTIYTNDLAAIKQLRQAKQWDEALNAIATTQQLLQNYPGLVSNTSSLNAERELTVKGKYGDLYQLADNSIRQQKLDQALQQARQAAAFAADEQLNIGRQSEAQIAKVQRLRYQRFVSGGDKAKSNGQYAEALNQYERAQQLEEQLPYLDISATLQENIKLTAILEVERIYSAVMASAATDNSVLENNQQQIQQLASRYGISTHVRVQEVMQQLDEQQCLNARDRMLPVLEQQLTQEQAASNFIAARSSLKEIEALLGKYPHCGLSNYSVLSNKDIVEACASYQDALQAAQSAESDRRFRRAIEQYVTAAELYQNPSVQARLAGHDAFRLFDYISTHHDHNMTLAGGHYLLDQQQYEQSLTLLNLLVQRGVHARETEHLQTRLGTALAIRHYMNSADWKTTYYGFVAKENRKDYREMYKAFRKQWRRMT